MCRRAGPRLSQCEALFAEGDASVRAAGAVAPDKGCDEIGDIEACGARGVRSRRARVGNPRRGPAAIGNTRALPGGGRSPVAGMGAACRPAVADTFGLDVVESGDTAQPERVTRTDLEMRLAAIGGRGALMEADETGGIDLALKADAFWLETEAEAVSNEGNTTADASRLRLALEGSRAFAMGGGIGRGATGSGAGELSEHLADDVDLVGRAL